jgi:hypothetical protein
MSQHKLYIIEGADRVGKSTIANLLAAKLDLPVCHTGKPDAHLQATEGHNYQYHYLLTDKQSRVLDRSWISGWFYDLFRRQLAPNVRAGWQLESQLTEAGYELIVIYVYRPWTPSLAAEHNREIANSEGYGDQEQRALEHFAWPYFVNQVATKGYSQADFMLATAYPSPINYLARHHNEHNAPRPSASLFSYRLSKVFEQQSAYGCDPSFWSAVQWLDVNPSRTSCLYESVIQEGRHLKDRCFK